MRRALNLVPSARSRVFLSNHRLAYRHKHTTAPSSTSSTPKPKPKATIETLPYAPARFHPRSPTTPTINPSSPPKTNISAILISLCLRILRTLKNSRHFKWVARRAIPAIILLLLIHIHILSVAHCGGPSMLPTLNVRGDWVLISRLHSGSRLHGGNSSFLGVLLDTLAGARVLKVEVGDLVSFHHPVRQGVNAIKRVVGVEGDYVLRDTPREDYDERSVEPVMVQVPQGHVWVAGDNLLFSRDSRNFGAVPLALVRGKVVARFAPWGERRWFGGGLREREWDG